MALETSNRIKLTEKDLDVVETVEGNAFLETPIQYTIQECKELKAQILDDHEKAKKYDFIKNSLLNPQKFDDKVTLEQEIIQLKEELKEWTTKPELNLSDIFHNAFGGAWSQEEEDYLFNCEYALELQELVKEWLEETKQPIPEGHVPLISLGGLTQKLQSIIEKSEK